MVATMTSRVTKKPASKPPQDPRVLLMCEDPMDVAMWGSLLGVLGCKVQACSSFIELLLRIEHEPYQMVMILEGLCPTPGWKTAAMFAAEVARGIPFFVIHRNGEAVGLSTSTANLN